MKTALRNISKPVTHSRQFLPCKKRSPAAAEAISKRIKAGLNAMGVDVKHLSKKVNLFAEYLSTCLHNIFDYCRIFLIIAEYLLV